MAFLEHREEYGDPHIYTDGSSQGEGVGYSAIFPNCTFSGGLTAEASIFTAELYAIKTAVKHIVEENKPRREYVYYLFRFSECTPGTQTKHTQLTTNRGNQATDA